MSNYNIDPLWGKIHAQLGHRQAEGWKDLALGLGLAVSPMAEGAADANLRATQTVQTSESGISPAYLWRELFGLNPPHSRWDAILCDFFTPSTGEPNADVYVNRATIGMERYLERESAAAGTRAEYHHMMATLGLDQVLRDAARRVFERLED